MASTALIVGGLAAGGLLAYVLYKKFAAPKPPPPKPGDDCKALCDATLSGDAKTACELACAAAGLVGDIPNPFHNGSDDAKAAISKGDADNKKLNGEVEIKLADQLQGQTSYGELGSGGGIMTMSGSVLRFKNGCVPFKDAIGFDKCKKGTHSMWINESDIDVDDEFNHGAIPAFANDALAKTYMDEHQGGAVLDNATKSEAMAGTADLKHPDPTTVGPFDAGDYLFWTRTTQPAPAGWKTGHNQKTGDPYSYLAIPGGQQGWYFRGEPMLCNYGDAPDLWDEQGNPRPVDWRHGEEARCVPSGRKSNDTYGDGKGHGQQTSTTCEQNNADGSMTWIATGDWTTWNDAQGGHHTGPWPYPGFFKKRCFDVDKQNADGTWSVASQTCVDKKLNPDCAGGPAPTTRGPAGTVESGAAGSLRMTSQGFG